MDSGSLLRRVDDGFVDVVIGEMQRDSPPWMGGLWLLRVRVHHGATPVANDRDDELNVIVSGSSPARHRGA